ncbi:MAG: hypothetical protein HY812_09930 [Planctomycetes bacterium]|nr:hypothetical protein [Planctomycetota bacterium]
MSESCTNLAPHGAVSPPPQNVGEGFKKAKYEMTAREKPKGLVPNVRFFLEQFGHMMSRLVLTILYVLLVAPVGVFYRFLGDPFMRRYPRRGSSFTPWKSANSSLRQARRQD